jgi:hypothetical protein
LLTGSPKSVTVTSPPTTASCTFNGQTVADGSSVTAYRDSSNATQCVSETRTCSNGTLSGSYTNASCTVSTAVSNIRPIGYFDNITSAGVIQGWTLNKDMPAVSIPFHVYMDGPGGIGTFIGSGTANVSRPDVDQALNVTGDHGISWQIPSQYLNAARTFYVYGINTNGNSLNTLLTGSPKTFAPGQASATDRNANLASALTGLQGALMSLLQWLH